MSRWFWADHHDSPSSRHRNIFHSTAPWVNFTTRFHFARRNSSKQAQGRALTSTQWNPVRRSRGSERCFKQKCLKCRIWYGGSWNRVPWGTPKSSMSMEFSIINHPFWGTPHFRKTPYVRRIWCTMIFSSDFFCMCRFISQTRGRRTSRRLSGHLQLAPVAKA